ncbi:hypothetical protein [Kordia periserrulae]|nr:hypothetical protein [Kordia periserrulae]
MIPKKLTLKKVTVAIHQVYGGENTSQENPEDTENPTLSSAYHQPTENDDTNRMFLSVDVDICV